MEGVRSSSRLIDYRGPHAHIRGILESSAMKLPSSSSSGSGSSSKEKKTARQQDVPLKEQTSNLGEAMEGVRSSSRLIDYRKGKGPHTHIWGILESSAMKLPSSSSSGSCSSSSEANKENPQVPKKTARQQDVPLKEQTLNLREVLKIFAPGRTSLEDCDVEQIQDVYICDVAAFKALNAAMHSDKRLRVMLEKGYFYLCAPGQEQELGPFPAGWQLWIYDSLTPTTAEWRELLTPFRRLFHQHEFKKVEGSLRTLVMLSQNQYARIPMIRHNRRVFTTGNKLLYGCLTKLQESELRELVKPIYPKRSPPGVRRLWNVCQSMDPRDQIWLCCCHFHNASLMSNWDAREAAPVAWDSYVCDQAAYEKLKSPAAMCGNEVHVAVRYGVFYKLTTAEEGNTFKLAEDGSGHKYPGWKLWVTTQPQVEQHKLVAVVREVLGEHGFAELDASIMESFGDFIRLCGAKREDVYPAVPKQLLVFCTGNHRFFRFYLGDRQGWEKLKRVVRCYLNMSEEELQANVVFRAWDVSQSEDPAKQQLLEHPAWPRLSGATYVVDYSLFEYAQ